MATVYLAEDVKHERKVAPEGSEAGARRGAGSRALPGRDQDDGESPASAHPGALFDSGEANGFLYYVMPYVEGETLRARLEREGQLGVEQSVRIAREVADALDYAHRAGVIHRDIKPANILLHDGRPVVADFGIALAVSAAGGGRLTETGLSLGTPHYMSPEQASADRDLTARSDVYSLGCVLYEMLAGQPPHTGPSAQRILVSILTEAPEAARGAAPHGSVERGGRGVEGDREVAGGPLREREGVHGRAGGSFVRVRCGISLAGEPGDSAVSRPGARLPWPPRPRYGAGFPRRTRRPHPRRGSPSPSRSTGRGIPVVR